MIDPGHVVHYPSDLAAREAFRHRIRTRELAVAESRIRSSCRSLRCGAGDHDCRNDGTTCICECHDPKEPR